MAGNPLSLTAQDSNNGAGYNNVNKQATAFVGSPKDLYVGEQPASNGQPGGTAILTISSQNGVQWTISPTSANGMSEVSTPNHGVFNGANVRLTLTPADKDYFPGDLEYVLTATLGQVSAVITIHVLKLIASTETIGKQDPWVPGSGNGSGIDLSPAIQQTTGAYVPWDTLDENYDGIPDYLETSGGSYGNVQSVPHKAVDGDTLMMYFRLPDVGAGTYFLNIPNASGFAVFADSEGDVRVTNNTPISASESGGLYVQGIQGSFHGMLWLNWSVTNDPGTITINHADGLMITTFTWTGSQDVPDNATYEYAVSTTKDMPTSSQWVLAQSVDVSNLSYVPNPKFPNTVNKSDALVSWGNGPAFGEAVYEVNGDYSWEFTVNIVLVEVNSAPTNKITVTKDKADMYPLSKGHTAPLISATTVTPPDQNPAMSAQAGLQGIVGPSDQGVMRGVKWMEAGFIQQVKIVSQSGIGVTLGKTNAYTGTVIVASQSFPDPALNRSDGKIHIDGAGQYPWMDPGNITNKNPSLSATAFVSYNNSGHSLIPNVPYDPAAPNLNDDSNSDPTIVTLKVSDTPKVYGSANLFMTANNMTAEVNSVDIGGMKRGRS